MPAGNVNALKIFAVGMYPHMISRRSLHTSRTAPRSTANHLNGHVCPCLHALDHYVSTGMESHEGNTGVRGAGGCHRKPREWTGNGVGQAVVQQGHERAEG